MCAGKSRGAPRSYGVRIEALLARQRQSRIELECKDFCVVFGAKTYNIWALEGLTARQIREARLTFEKSYRNVLRQSRNVVACSHIFVSAFLLGIMGGGVSAQEPPPRPLRTLHDVNIQPQPAIRIRWRYAPLHRIGPEQ